MKVGVLGANGKMGRAVCDAVEADPDLDLVARVDPFGGEGCDSSRDTLVANGAEVVIDGEWLDERGFVGRSGRAHL